VLGALAGTGLSAEEQAAVVTIALARYAGQTPAQLGELVAKLVLTVNPDAAAARETDATVRRQVRVRAVEDGQGLLVARGPLAMIEAMRAALQAGLAAPTDPDDLRTQEAREFDLLHALTTGAGAGGSGGGGGGGWHAAIVVPYATAAGGDLELAEIPGLGPVLPGVARELLESCLTLTRIAVDGDGKVLEVSDVLPGPAAQATDTDRWLTDLAAMPVRIGIPLGSSSYRPSERLRRYVQARDRTCTFPGCTRPARRTDIDHRLHWPLGLTDPENTHCLCRRHHRAKQTLFTVIGLPDGTTRWITRGGWWFDRPPQGY
jgi:hypothetical protein